MRIFKKKKERNESVPRPRVGVTRRRIVTGIKRDYWRIEGILRSMPVILAGMSQDPASPIAPEILTAFALQKSTTLA